MRKFNRAGILTICMISVLLVVSASVATAGMYSMPETFNSSSSYMFFFHNYYVEKNGPDGICKYNSLLENFAGHGQQVISYLRTPGADFSTYVKEGTEKIREALQAGVPPENITVSGHSKGAVIVLAISEELQEPGIKYVILAGCQIKGLVKVYPESNRLAGNYLSVYADSDKIAGSCGTLFKDSKDKVSHEEIVLSSPEGHKLFFEPRDIWSEPVFAWLKEQQKAM